MRKRKLIVVAVVACVLLVGGIAGGAILAADDSPGESQIIPRPLALLERACAIYQEQTGVAIDQEQLKDALKQARQEMREEALENWLQKLVDNGRITQEEADQLLEWWQSRPDIDVPLPEPGGQMNRVGMMWGRGPQPPDAP
jgi:uncharacterized membrane protein